MVYQAQSTEQHQFCGKLQMKACDSVKIHLPLSSSITVNETRPLRTIMSALVKKQKNCSSCSISLSLLSGNGSSIEDVSALIVTEFFAVLPAKSTNLAATVAGSVWRRETRDRKIRGGGTHYKYGITTFCGQSRVNLPPLPPTGIH